MASDPALETNLSSERKEILNFIDGKFITSSANKTYKNFDPTNGVAFANVHEASAADVDAAVRAAKAAQVGEWGQMPIAERVAMLYKVADRINERFDEFLTAECLDTGKPYSLASHIDIPRGAANFKIFADVIKNVPTECFRMETPDGAGALNYGVRVPKGVIAVICPWNLPLLLMTWKVGPALACGNTVVVKPSEETPSTASLLGEVMNEVGMPAGVYNVVNGFGPESAGEFLTKHQDVDAITFTGETVTGAAIMQNAAVGIRDVSFELGGKNAGIIFADCDLDAALDGTARSAFANCGQVCLGTERIYVERAIFDDFVAGLKEKAEALKIGLPQDEATGMGPMVSQQQREKVLGYYVTIGACRSAFGLAYTADGRICAS
ncbi:MAG: aldehyde dehydrogenase family protein, partial [Pseudomonadota bacterium]